MITESAPAKVNLTLRVLGRRADGYHDLESLVTFADIGDELSFAPNEPLGLEVRGPQSAATGPTDDNLVLKAARALAERVPGLTLGHFVLTKHLPVAAGLGGGSADAAAALRLLARENDIASRDPRLMAAARATGADVPVCLDPRPRVMRGIGDVLSEPLDLPRLPAVLVNPGVPLATQAVFRTLGLKNGEQGSPHTADLGTPKTREGLFAYIAAIGNDLEKAAIALQPSVATVLAALRATAECRLARMSGSGATCFGLFVSTRAATAAARSLGTAHPGWWIRTTALG